MRNSSRYPSLGIFVAAFAFICSLNLAAFAQQATIRTPYRSVGDSFYENMGIGFGFNLRGSQNGRGVVGLQPNGQPTANGDIQFRQPWAGGVGIPFGGGNNAGGPATAGAAVHGNGGTAFFNLFGQSGSNRTNVTQVPIVTVGNGGQGTIIDAVQRPFVTGLVPVVGDWGNGLPQGVGSQLAPQGVSPVQQRLDRLKAGERPSDGPATSASSGSSAANTTIAPSTAARGDLSVAEIRRQQAAAQEEQDHEVLALREKARGYEATGKIGVAKVYYRMAHTRATGETKSQLADKLRSLGDTKVPTSK